MAQNYRSNRQRGVYDRTQYGGSASGAGATSMNRPPSFDQADETQYPAALDATAHHTRGRRSESIAGLQNAELHLDSQRPSSGQPAIAHEYHSHRTPPTPHYEPSSYVPQQYGVPQAQHIRRASNSGTTNSRLSHTPYVPAAYQTDSSMYQPIQESQPQSLPLRSLAHAPAPPPPPPPPRPRHHSHGSRTSPPIGLGQFSTIPPLPPRQQPLPSLPYGPSPPLANSYIPPVPPPPPFLPDRDAFPSNAGYTHDAPHSQHNVPSPLSIYNPLPPLPNQDLHNVQRTLSPAIHRRPVPNNHSLPPTPGTPGTPGPTPPPHSPQRADTIGRHPQARPLPGRPPSDGQSNDYFGSDFADSGSQDASTGVNLGYDDLMQEVEAAVMGRPVPSVARQSPGSRRMPARGSEDGDQSAQLPLVGMTQAEQESIHDRHVINGHTAGMEESDHMDYDTYSDGSDAVAEAGLAAMEEADARDAVEDARRQSRALSHRASPASQASARGQSRSSDLDDGRGFDSHTASYGPGRDYATYHGDVHSSLKYEDTTDRWNRPDVSTRHSHISNTSDEMTYSDGALYDYPMPSQESIHPFAPARVDTAGTGGLQKPGVHPRRLSFEDGDESILAESEGNQTSGTQSPASSMPDMFFFPGASRPLPPAPGQLAGNNRVPQLMPAGTYQNPERLLQYDQYGRSTFPIAPDAYNQLLTPSGTPVPRSSSLVSRSTVEQAVPPIRSKTDADKAKILKEQQRQGLRSASVYGSDYLGDASLNPSAGDLGLPEIPAGKRGKLTPSKLASSDFKKCSEPWALSSVVTWLREMGEGEAYLKEHAIVDSIVALFTHKVATMNTADAEILSGKVVKSMLDAGALFREEEWVKFGTESMPAGVLFQLTGTGCYSPRNHADDSPHNITHQNARNRCYSHHCMRTLRKINLQTQPMEPQRKVEDWVTFYDLKKADIEDVDKKLVERQNNLHEIVTSEDLYMDQLDVVRVLYRDTLFKAHPPVIDPKRRDAFLRDVFGKADSIKQVNEDFLLSHLKYRQQEQGPWIKGFSDIFREWIRKAKVPYIEYCASFPDANLLIRQESERNIMFREFLDRIREEERSKRLGWDTYLKAPITRLQRYVLLLDTVYKHMAQESEEKTNLHAAIEEIKAVTHECDAKVADKTRHVELKELAVKLQLRPGMEKVHLNLTHLGREIVFQGDLQRMGSNKFTWLDCHTILFDHYLVLAKTIEKRDTASGVKSEKYDVSKVPIPMDLLVLESRDDDPVVKSSVKGLGSVGAVTSKVQPSYDPRGHQKSATGSAGGPGTLVHTNTASSAASVQTNGSSKTLIQTTILESSNPSEKVMYPFRIRHLGRTEVYVLYAPTAQNRDDWCDKIVTAKTKHADSLYKQNAEPFRLRVVADTAFAYDAVGALGRKIVINGTPLDRAIRDVERLFEGTGPRANPVCRATVNCATAFNQPFGIAMVAVGTDFGVYISDYNNPRGWSRAVAASRVTQIAVLEEFSLMILISDKSLIAHHLDTVCPHASTGPAANNTSETSSRRAPQKLSGARDIGFFAHGRMKDRQLVFYKKRDGISSTFKVLEPVYQKSSQNVARNRFGIRKGTTEFFRDFDEFYIPSETYAINLFQSTLAIATAKGIEVMTLDKKVPLSIPDLKPPDCASIAQRLGGQKPLGMFRLSDSEFLLVFEEVGIYVNKHGDVSRAVVMEFVGRAKQACLVGGMYLILVDYGGGFVEVRNAINGRLRQVVSGRDVRLLDDGGKAGTVKICMQHPEWERCQIILEMIVNEGLEE